MERDRRGRFHSWVSMIPWRRKWQPTPVFLPWKFYGQRSLAGCSPWGRRVRHNWVTFTFCSQSLEHCLTLGKQSINTYELTSGSFCHQQSCADTVLGPWLRQGIYSVYKGQPPLWLESSWRTRPGTRNDTCQCFHCSTNNTGNKRRQCLGIKENSTEAMISGSAFLMHGRWAVHLRKW